MAATTLKATAALLLCMCLATPAVALICYKGQGDAPTPVEVTDDHCIWTGVSNRGPVIDVYDSGTLQDCTRYWVRPDTNGVHCCNTDRCNAPNNQQDAVEFPQPRDP